MSTALILSSLWQLRRFAVTGAAVGNVCCCGGQNRGENARRGRITKAHQWHSIDDADGQPTPEVTNYHLYDQHMHPNHAVQSTHSPRTMQHDHTPHLNYAARPTHCLKTMHYQPRSAVAPRGSTFPRVISNDRGISIIMENIELTLLYKRLNTRVTNRGVGAASGNLIPATREITGRPPMYPAHHVPMTGRQETSHAAK